MEAASDEEGEKTKPPLLSYEELQPSDYENDDDHVPKRMRPPPKAGATLGQTTLHAHVGLAPPRPAPMPAGGYLVVDLFCSVGGVSCGAVLEGHTVVLGIDFDAKRLAVHACNHPAAAHAELHLGPDTEERVVALIRKAVPVSEWHRLWVHASPPCQSQSSFRALGKHRNRCQHQRADERGAEKQKGLSTVNWTLRLVERLNPPQFSFEEVSDAAGAVKRLVQSFRARLPKLFDCEVIDMVEFGVPQTRTRLIAARPATMHALRRGAALRVDQPVAIRDVLTPPEGAAFLRSRKSRKVDPSKVVPCPNSPGMFTDGFVQFYPLDKPAPTQMCTAPHWDAADFSAMPRLTPDDCRRLATFPEDFRWPEGVTKAQQEEGYGNAVPPLFARKLFRAASTAV